MNATTELKTAKIAVTLRGGYYVCATGHRGKSHARGANEGCVSPIFLSREQASTWAKRHGWQMLDV